MTNRTRQAIGGTIAAATIAGVAMVFLDMQPRLVLVVGVVVLIATTAWLVVELGLVTSPIVWYNYATEADTSARPDRRVQVLRSRLRQPARRRRPQQPMPGRDPEQPDEIVDSLIAIIDDHLDAEHGLRWPDDADAIAAVLGPELTRFISDPATQRSMTQGRTLVRTVALIEEL